MQEALVTKRKNPEAAHPRTSGITFTESIVLVCSENEC